MASKMLSGKMALFLCNVEHLSNSIFLLKGEEKKKRKGLRSHLILVSLACGTQKTLPL